MTTDTASDLKFTRRDVNIYSHKASDLTTTVPAYVCGTYAVTKEEYGYWHVYELNTGRLIKDNLNRLKDGKELAGRLWLECDMVQSEEWGYPTPGQEDNLRAMLAITRTF